MNSKRKFQILKIIVEEFIRTSEPVGSETLLKKYPLNVSSATIRNVMKELEQEGYIEKTHVSSGRVPSAKGYQYYLDHLNEGEEEPVDLEFQKEFQKVLSSKTGSIEDALSKSCQLLSEMTKTATVVLGPKAEDEHLVSLQLIPLDKRSALGILITDSGYVEKKTFVIPDLGTANFSSYQSAVKVLNDHLVGTKLSEVETKAKEVAPLLIQMYGRSGEFVISALLESMLNFSAKHYAVYGEKNLLAYPEFSEDSEALLNAVSALDNPHALDKNVQSSDDLGDVRVGFTNDSKGDLAIVSKNLGGKDSIAVVGPKRMDYRKILSLLEYIAYMLERKFNPAKGSASSLVPVETPSDLAVAPEPKKKPSGKETKSKGGRK